MKWTLSFSKEKESERIRSRKAGKLSHVLGYHLRACQQLYPLSPRNTVYFTRSNFLFFCHLKHTSIIMNGTGKDRDRKGESSVRRSPFHPPCQQQGDSTVRQQSKAGEEVGHERERNPEVSDSRRDFCLHGGEKRTLNKSYWFKVSGTFKRNNQDKGMEVRFELKYELIGEASLGDTRAKALGMCSW